MTLQLFDFSQYEVKEENPNGWSVDVDGEDPKPSPKSDTKEDERDRAPKEENYLASRNIPPPGLKIMQLISEEVGFKIHPKRLEKQTGLHFSKLDQYLHHLELIGAISKRGHYWHLSNDGLDFITSTVSPDDSEYLGSKSDESLPKPIPKDLGSNLEGVPPNLHTAESLNANPERLRDNLKRLFPNSYPNSSDEILGEIEEILAPKSLPKNQGASTPSLFPKLLPKDIQEVAKDWTREEIESAIASLQELIYVHPQPKIDAIEVTPNLSLKIDKEMKLHPEGSIEEKIINDCGPYLYLRYREDGKQRSKYLGKASYAR